MCGRFALATAPEDLRQLVDFSNRINFPPRYNIAPTQPVSVIRAVPGREMALVQWGLVAPWLKPEQVTDKASRPQINARSETITEKPSFKKRLSPPPLPYSVRRFLRMGPQRRPALSHLSRRRAGFFHGRHLGDLGWR